MKKHFRPLFAIFLVFCLVLNMSGCGAIFEGIEDGIDSLSQVFCWHEWEGPTYEMPKTCTKCGKTEGEPYTLETRFPAGESRVAEDSFTFTQDDFEHLFDDAFFYVDLGVNFSIVPGGIVRANDKVTQSYNVLTDYGLTNVSLDIALNANGFVTDVSVTGPLSDYDDDYMVFIEALYAAVFVSDASFSDGSIPAELVPASIKDNIFNELSRDLQESEQESEDKIVAFHEQNDLSFTLMADSNFSSYSNYQVTLTIEPLALANADEDSRANTANS